MIKLVCDKCGGTNIETKVWVDANDNTVLESAFIDEQDNFCRDCQENVKFDEKEFSDDSDILYIKNVIKEWGNTTVTKLELESSPVINSIGDGDICELVDTFNEFGVDTIVYNHGTEIEYNSYNYENLNSELVSEIREIIEAYEVEMLKTEKRCNN